MKDSGLCVEIRFRVRGCRYSKYKPNFEFECVNKPSSSSSGAEPPLVGGFGLPNDILPFCSILNTGYPIFNLHLTKVLYDIVLPSILGSSFGLLVKGFHLSTFLVVLVSGILYMWPNQLSLWALM